MGGSLPYVAYQRAQRKAPFPPMSIGDRLFVIQSFVKTIWCQYHLNLYFNRWITSYIGRNAAERLFYLHSLLSS